MGPAVVAATRRRVVRNEAGMYTARSDFHHEWERQVRGMPKTLEALVQYAYGLVRKGANVTRQDGVRRRRIPEDLLRACSATLLILFLVPAGSLAQTPQEHTGHHKPHANMIGLFAGFTHEGRRDNAVALGLEYERRMLKRLGIGGVAEYTFGDHGFWVFAVPVVPHIGDWKIFAGPGVEDAEHSEFLVRIGGDYAFRLGNWEVSPKVNLDFVGGDIVPVLGVFFGQGFQLIDDQAADGH